MNVYPICLSPWILYLLALLGPFASTCSRAQKMPPTRYWWASVDTRFINKGSDEPSLSVASEIPRHVACLPYGSPIWVSRVSSLRSCTRSNTRGRRRSWQPGRVPFIRTFLLLDQSIYLLRLLDTLTDQPRLQTRQHRLHLELPRAETPDTPSVLAETCHQQSVRQIEQEQAGVETSLVRNANGQKSPASETPLRSLARSLTRYRSQPRARATRRRQCSCPLCAEASSASA